MQTKYEKYEQLAEETLSELASSKEKWQDFLSTSSRMYKYTFDEQVLIYAQRPETRACASFDLQDSVFKSLPKQIKNTEKYIQNLKMDIEAYSSRPVKKDDEGQIIFQGIEINGTLYNDKKEGGEALLEAFKNAVMKNISGKTSVGTYQGFEIKAMFDALSKCYVAELHGYGDYTVQLGSSETGNFTRLDNLLNSMQTNCENAKERYDNLCQQLEDAKQQLDKPFSREEELRQKETRLK